MLYRMFKVITLALMFQQCGVHVRAQASCSVSEVCCPDADCSKIAYGPKGETGLPGPSGLPGLDGLTGIPGRPAEKGNKGNHGMSGQDGQKGEKGDPCTCTPEGPGDIKAGNQNAEMPSVNEGLIAAICLLYVIVIVFVAVMVFLTWKNRTTMENFQKVLLSLAERDHINPQLAERDNLHPQGYADLDQGQREPPHKYDKLAANPPPDEDFPEGATYEDPASSVAYIEPLPPI